MHVYIEFEIRSYFFFMPKKEGLLKVEILLK